ncbi:hypothetical protein CMUS01_15154 [Colletotrichum musicola]|uniref:Uncharacterized protein n=1 Tax=Colletotrichum musicola TaxID=2175873 RepID=A0A8H6MP80_9PEZI|nr:hypothetical protein CMUS01_15154 [Colletotrichum musicola]
MLASVTAVFYHRRYGLQVQYLGGARRIGAPEKEAPAPISLPGRGLAGQVHWQLSALAAPTGTLQRPQATAGPVPSSEGGAPVSVSRAHRSRNSLGRQLQLQLRLQCAAVTGSTSTQHDIIRLVTEAPSASVLLTCEIVTPA